MKHLAELAAIGAAVGIAAPASGDIFHDDFESYPTGAFPGGAWQDIDSRVFDNPTPGPTMRVIDTVDARGNATRAIQSTQVGGTNGVFADLASSRVHTMSVDMRIDSTPRANSWPMAVGFTQQTAPGLDINRQSQAVVYAWSNRRFFLFVSQEFGGPAANLVLPGLTFTEDTWYTVSLTTDTELGTFQARILDAITGEVLSSRDYTASVWDPTLADYDSLSFFDGEPAGSTNGVQASLDNVRYVPAPSTCLVLGAICLGARRRR
ncbi:MAG: hypothetical protein AAGA55_00450 [Planctomycetota bacterium]